MSSGIWWPYCPSFNVLKIGHQNDNISHFVLTSVRYIHQSKDSMVIGAFISSASYICDILFLVSEGFGTYFERIYSVWTIACWTYTDVLNLLRLYVIVCETVLLYSWQVIILAFKLAIWTVAVTLLWLSCKLFAMSEAVSTSPAGSADPAPVEVPAEGSTMSHHEDEVLATADQVQSMDLNKEVCGGDGGDNGGMGNMPIFGA